MAINQDQTSLAVHPSFSCHRCALAHRIASSHSHSGSPCSGRNPPAPRQAGCKFGGTGGSSLWTTVKAAAGPSLCCHLPMQVSSRSPRRPSTAAVHSSWLGLALFAQEQWLLCVLSVSFCYEARSHTLLKCPLLGRGWGWHSALPIRTGPNQEGGYKEAGRLSSGLLASCLGDVRSLQPQKKSSFFSLRSLLFQPRCLATCLIWMRTEPTCYTALGVANRVWKSSIVVKDTSLR